jgi:hypothetical protein
MAVGRGADPQCSNKFIRATLLRDESAVADTANYPTRDQKQRLFD